MCAAPTGKKVHQVGRFFSATPRSEIAGSDSISPVGKILMHGMHDLGRIDGQDLVLDRVPAEGKHDRIGEPATEPGGRNPDVIVGGANNKLAQAIMIGDVP
jgi:hypothetical protein